MQDFYLVGGGSLDPQPWKQREGSRTGLREKLERNAVSVKSSANPTVGL